MSDKLSKTVRQNQEIAEDKISDIVSASNQSKVLQTQLLRIGAVGAVGRLAQNLSAQTIRALQNIRDNRDYESLGFSRFDDFLDDSEYAPMSYRQFNDREKLLLQEGEQLFDLYNNLKLSHKQRRLLGAGNVQVDDEAGTVTIITGEDTEEEIELSDRTRLLQTLSALADQNTILNSKGTKQKEKIERGEREVLELRHKLDEAAKRPGTTTVYTVFVQVNTSLALLTEMVVAVEESERTILNIYLDALETEFSKLKTAAGRMPASLMEMSDENRLNHIGKKLKGFKPESNEFSLVTSDLNDEELESLMS